MSCPKCQRERRPGDTACVRCGLLVERWDGFLAVEPELEALDQPWADLEARWDDDEQHARFLDLAASFDALDVAAARYRRVSRVRPDDERARTGLGRAVERAQELYVARARQEGALEAPARLKRVMPVLAVLVMIATALCTMALMRR